MALTAGARLGPYEIVSPLGAGGMGEVYRAKDGRLNRTVAIKILSDESAADADRRERFEREAKAISALDHPNICPLYDVGEHEGTYFLVMPCLEGQTLADRIAKGALPPDQAIKHAIEIATALDAAHRHGIIHRDLKPGNIMLTKTGVKLLDFGLAKLKKAAGPLGDTTMVKGTGIGTLLGTMPYMAPEQIEGRDVDARSDIFSLGAVMYEMVTGQRAFKGDSPASVIGSILKDEPEPLRALQPVAPVLLDRIVTTCLAKDPDERWQSAADIARELKWITNGVEEDKATSPPRGRSWWWPLAVTATVLAAVAASSWPAFRGDPPDSTIKRLSILPPPNGKFSTALSSIGTAQVAFSPDARFVAFVAETPEQRPHIWLRGLDTLEPRALPGTAEAMYPFWSADSRAIGFFAEGKLRTVNVAGGPAATVCDAPLDARGGDWNNDGTIIFSPSANDVVHRVAATGGTPTPVTQLDKSRAETSHRFPRFLPDGRRFVYVVRSEVTEHMGVALGSLDSKETRRLASGIHSSAQIANPDSLLFLNSGTLMARSLDLPSLVASGEPVTIAENVGSNSTSYSAFSIAGSALVYAPRARMAGELWWFSRDGAAQQLAAPEADYLDFELSPDARSLAVSKVDEQHGLSDVWTIDLERQISTRLTTDFLNDASVTWSPDGAELIFRSNRHGNSDLFKSRADAAGTEQVWLRTGSNLIVTDWSERRGVIVFTNARRMSGFDVWTWNIDGKSKPELTVRTRQNAAHGRVSPDGRWLAYASDESGQWQVYAQPLPPTGNKRQISVHGGSEPRWRADGEELFFLSTAQQIMSVSVPGGNAFATGAPKALFQTRVPLPNNVYRSNYTVSRDGQRFLVNVSSAGSGLTEPLIVVLNWPALLR